MSEITERIVDSSGGVRIAVYEEGNPDGPTLVMVHGWPDSHVRMGRRCPVAGRPIPHRALRQPRRWVNRLCPKPVSAYTMVVLCRRLRRGDRRDGSRRAGARAGARLGIGGHVGVPVPSRRERSRRLVHVGVRAQRRPPRSLHHRQPASGRIVRSGLLQCAEPVAAVRLHGLVLHTRASAARSLRTFLADGAARRSLRGPRRNPRRTAAPLRYLHSPTPPTA